jgi:hypothetical protein
MCQERSRRVGGQYVWLFGTRRRRRHFVLGYVTVLLRIRTGYFVKSCCCCRHRCATEVVPFLLLLSLTVENQNRLLCEVMLLLSSHK